MWAEPIPTEILEEIEVDPSLKKVAETLYNQTRKEAYTPKKNTLRGWKEGRPFEIEVPEDIYNVFSSMAPQERGPIAKLFGATNRLFSKGISLAPRKFGSIFGRDALSSLVYSRTGSNPISIAEALSDVYNAKPVYKEFGQLWGVSPVKLERTIKNFGTQIASDMLALTDEIAYATGLAEDNRPEQEEANYLLLGNFLSKSPPSRTKYANEFYEYLDEATKNKNAQKVILEKGITDAELDPIDYSASTAINKLG